MEFGFDDQRNLLVADVVGTPDECRFTADGVPLSKELLRTLYRRTPWYEEVQRAKGKDRLRWKALVSDPPPLKPEAVELVSQMYMAMANGITGRRWFDVPPLGEVLKGLKGVIGQG